MKKALLQLHLAILLAGFSGILGRLIDLKEGPLVWYRMGIASLVLFIFLSATGRMKRVTRVEALKLLGVGCFLAIHWLCFYGSIKYANVSVALVCFSASAFFSAFLDPLILRRRFSWMEILLSLIAVAGIYVILHFDRRFALGILLGTAAAFFSALFTVLSKRLTEKHDPYTLSFYELVSGFIFLTLILPFYLHLFPNTSMKPGWMDWLYLAILSIACTVLAFFWAFSSLKEISPFTTNLSYNLEPIYGIILAFLIFHENTHLNDHFLWGCLLILVSVGLQSLRMSRVYKKIPKRFTGRFRIPWG
jgi:drug/metabolite transporter (DMT)-like permease